MSNAAPSPNPVPPVPVALGYVEEHDTLAQAGAALVEPDEGSPEELAEGADVIHAITDPANDDIIEHLKHSD